MNLLRNLVDFGRLLVDELLLRVTPPAEVVDEVTLPGLPGGSVHELSAR